MEALGLGVFTKFRIRPPPQAYFHVNCNSSLGNNSNYGVIFNPLSITKPTTATPSNSNFTTGPVNPNDKGSVPEPNEFHLNSGKAIDTLRTELPYYFERGLQDFSIYDSGVTLTEPQHYRFYIRGLQWYRRFLGCARHVLNWYFSDLTLNIQSISRPSDDELHVRWQMEGTPNTSIFRQSIRSYLSRSGLLFFKTLKTNRGGGGADDYHGDVLVEKTVYEGRFVYRFGRKDGRVVEHSIENLLPAPKTFVPLSAISWWQRGGKLDLELNSSTRV